MAGVGFADSATVAAVASGGGSLLRLKVFRRNEDRNIASVRRIARLEPQQTTPGRMF